MGLSSSAVTELNALVVELYTRLAQARERLGESSLPPNRADHELTRDEYMERHRRRFDALGISESTQGELLQAAAFVWRAMHDPTVSREELEVAQTIKKMMAAMGGPPPCCDDNVVEATAS